MALIYSSIVYRKEAFIKGMIWAITGLFLLYLVEKLNINRSLGVLLLLLTFLPFPFLNLLIKKYFAKKVNIVLNELSFTITIKRKFKKEIPFKFNFNEINKYCVEFPAAKKFSSITFNLKNGKSVEYSFLTEKQNPEDINTEELIDMFHAMIKSYNTQLTPEHRILLKPSFISSKSGFICIIGLNFLLATAVILHIIYQPETLPLTLFFGFILTIQVMSKRKVDLDYYKKMS